MKSLAYNKNMPKRGILFVFSIISCSVYSVMPHPPKSAAWRSNSDTGQIASADCPGETEAKELPCFRKVLSNPG